MADVPKKLAKTKSPIKYEGISAQGFSHPADRAAAAAIRSVPMLDTVVKRLTEWTYERRLKQILLGQAVRIDEGQLPDVYLLHKKCAETLDIEKIPALYVTQFPIGNAMTVGAKEPTTLVMSGLVVGYEENELHSVLGHEMVHVLAEHVSLNTALELIRMILSGLMRGQPFARLPISAIYYVLLEWSRAAELTADRAAALAVNDPLVVCKTLMRIAGGPIKDMNLEAFIRQATEYDEEEDLMKRWSRSGQEIGSTHPFPVRRVKELVNWVASGDFDRIRSGSYVRRGHEPAPSNEFNSAFQHYKTRFSSVVDRAGTGIQTVIEKITGWLDGKDHNISDEVDFDEEK